MRFILGFLAVIQAITLHEKAQKMLQEGANPSDQQAVADGHCHWAPDPFNPAKYTKVCTCPGGGSTYVRNGQILCGDDPANDSDWDLSIK